MPPVPALTLSDGAPIPVVGLGTWSLRGDAGAAAVAGAVRSGYRLIDSAQGYDNEEAVGRGLRGSGVDRGELVVTTKLPNGDHGHDATLASFDRSYEALGLGPVDLYLIHWPVPEQDRFVDSWRAIVRLRDEGRIRSIGVSNFSIEQVERVEREVGERPAVNQVELRIGHAQEALREHHREQGIVVESYSPLKHGSALAADPVVTAIAAAHGVAWNQVVLRWNLQLGTVVIPRSRDAARQASNLDLFGFELDDAEMGRLSALRP